MIAAALAALLAATAPQPGRIVDGLACPSDPRQTYALYLPTTYTPEKKWPLLFVFDPRGAGADAAEVFRAAAEELGVIVAASNDTRSDGPWEPNARAVRAMWPDVRAAYAVDERRIYAAGFSGGHTVAWLLAKDSGAVAGLVAVGGRLRAETRADPPATAWYGLAGDADFNHLEMKAIAAGLQAAGRDHRLASFAGEHEWPPPGAATDALRWLELIALRDGRRAPDPAFVERALAADLARARAEEEAGALTAALRQHESIVASYHGVADTAASAAAAARLRASKEQQRVAKDERKWDAWEREQVAVTGAALARVAAREEAVVVAAAAAEVGIDTLLGRARRSGPEGAAARRVLSWLRVQSAFYLWRDLDGSGALRRAALMLGLACEITPERAVLHVRHATALAKAGDRKAALAALGRGLDAGFADRERLAAEPLLAPLLDAPEIRRRLDPR
ncbi:MAG: hypothetical protein NDJ94_06765 [Vicinamibacteria bacterium]|nr:hypothetical protein [Vicinamibacteria bacterium]